MKDLAGDAFILLVNLFDDKTVKVATPEFAKKLIDSIQYIVDEDTVHALISILVCVLPYFEKVRPGQNIILDEFIRDEEFFNRKLLYLMNRGSMYRLDKIMHTIACIMTNSASEKFFNENDIDTILRQGCAQLNERNSSKARVHLLRVLNIILDKHEFWVAYPERVKHFNTTVEE